MKKVLEVTVVILLIIFLLSANALAVENSEALDLDVVKQEIGEAEEEIEEIEENVPEDIEEIENNTEVGDTVSWTDLSKATISFQMGESGYEAVIKGVTLQANHYIHILVSNSQSELQATIDEEKYVSEYDTFFTKYDDGSLIARIQPQISQLNKDMYYYIAESVGSEKKALTTIKKLDRPALPRYGKRLDIYFVNKSYLSVYQSIFNYPQYNRKISYKIGKITNNDLLRKFKTNETQAFNELYSFAKNDSGIYNGTAYVGKEGQANPVTNLNIQNNEYYYCYMVMDDENGKYLPMDDVAIYQGSDKVIIHFAFASMKIDDANPVNNDPTTAKEPYPKTGTIVLGSIATLLIGSAFVFFIKNRNLKDVK